MNDIGPFRLASGGLIDRERTLSFTFDRRSLEGFHGDTLASALLANRVRVVSRSMKFHRPRGIFSCGPEEPNALVQLSKGADAIPSARATITPLTENLHAISQSGWPNAGFDVLRALDAVAPLLSAGFYHKTFKWPSWHWFEPAIRRMAGLGRCPTLPDPDRYDVRNAHCNVLIVGAGVAGLSAAEAAARKGLRVILVEQDAELGGHARWCPTTISGRNSADWIRGTADALSRSGCVTVLTRTTAVGAYDHGTVTLAESHPREDTRERLWIVRADRIVLATGAVEQPLVFDHNDRPGIMLAGAAHQFLKRHAIAPGNRVLLATNNDTAYVVARDLLDASVPVIGIADSRGRVSCAIAEDVRRAGVPVYLATMPISTTGSKVLRAVTLGKVGNGTQDRLRVECDALLISGGWSPNLQLYSQAGGKLTFIEDAKALMPVDSVPRISIVGQAAMISHMDRAVAHAAHGVGDHESSGAPRDHGEIGPRICASGDRWRQWVDLRHDVTVGDLELAVRENYRSIEHVKRYTALGMSVDQGKTSSLPAIEIVSEIERIAPSTLGHTTLRPPVVPVTLGTIAGMSKGELYAPWRETPLHAQHAARNAVFSQYGEWKRPSCYPRPGEREEDAILREVRKVRSCAGLFDASPLGKIEVTGPDAGRFLDRFYINRLDTLRRGRVRYGIMLRETGVVFDDGTITELGADSWLITTTSGNAGRVFAWLEEWRQCEWPSLRVSITPVTEQWATISLAGPQARAILSKLQVSCNLSNDAFPHMSMRTANLMGMPARIYRVSFTGELNYEINIPAARAPKVWEALLAAGCEYELDAFGVEALLRLRLEKGFLHVGTDTDGTTVPDDIGFGGIAAAKAGDFIGKRSLRLPENLRDDRLQLVGVSSPQPNAFRAGCHVRLKGSNKRTDGWITSAGTLSSEGSSIGLAMIRRGRSRVTDVASIYDDGRCVATATLVTPPFYDPMGARLHG